MIDVPIPGFEGRYTVREDGTVTSLKGWRVGVARKPVLNRQTGYLGVNLWNGQKYVTKHIHRLIAEQFVPPVPGKTQVNHIDDNKLNNRVDNLEWVTLQENTRLYTDSIIKPSRIIISKTAGKKWKDVQGYNYICQCPQCDEQFPVKGCYVNSGQKIFCSLPCIRKYKLTNRKRRMLN